MKKIMLVLMAVMFVAILMPGSAIASTTEAEQGCVVTAKTTIPELLVKGDGLRKQKEYAEAITCYEAGLRLERTNAIIYNRIGMAELQMGEYKSAESDFAKAVKYDPKFAEAYNNIGIAAYGQKRYASAVKNLKKALALNETSATFHVNLGTCWFAQGKFDRAVAEYTRGLELDPDVLMRGIQSGIAAQVSSPEERGKYSYTVAKLYAKRGAMERSLELLKKAKEDGYNIAEVYRDQEFASLRQDARLAQLIPPPMK
jgi:tetratricopeptide (TPR) repeat protein